MLRRFGIIAVLALLVTAFAAVPVLAQNPHFIRGPFFSDQGTQLLVTGTVAGLGNEDIDVVVDATGIATVECINPGGNRAPGQDTTVDVSGEANDVQVKNGRATFRVLTDEPLVTGAEACPNPAWTADVTEVEFTEATITIFQPAGTNTIVFEETFEL
jgi:hypothetical protein